MNLALVADSKTKTQSLNIITVRNTSNQVAHQGPFPVGAHLKGLPIWDPYFRAFLEHRS